MALNTLIVFSAIIMASAIWFTEKTVTYQTKVVLTILVILATLNLLTPI